MQGVSQCVSALCESSLVGSRSGLFRTHERLVQIPTFDTETANHGAWKFDQRSVFNLSNANAADTENVGDNSERRTIWKTPHHVE